MASDAKLELMDVRYARDTFCPISNSACSVGCPAFRKASNYTYRDGIFKPGCESPMLNGGIFTNLIKQMNEESHPDNSC